jgi:8-oxo-dGTP pyrophosphatase MutT (NUDIX family)
VRHRTSARRELAEELGVSGVSLQWLFTFRYDEPPVRYHAFCYEVRWDGPITHQASEVVSGDWLPLTELRARLADPDWPFVPDGRVAIELWFDQLQTVDQDR